MRLLQFLHANEATEYIVQRLKIQKEKKKAENRISGDIW